MFTEYDKAIAAFLTSLLGLLTAFKLNIPFITQDTILAVTPFLTLVVTWLVPNKPSSIAAVPLPMAGTNSTDHGKP